MSLTISHRTEPKTTPSVSRAASSSAVRAGGALLLLSSFVIVRLLWQGRYTGYVRPAMGIPLGIAAAVLAALGGYGMLRRDCAGLTVVQADAHEGHAHGVLPKVCWLLAVPILVLTLIAPGPLGAANSAATAAPTSVSFHPAPLPADRSAIISLKLRDLLGWTTADPNKLLLHRPLRLIGMAARVTDNGRLVRLTRYTITCCAADAEPFSADITLPADSLVPAKGGWIEIVGMWNGQHSSDGWPEIDGATVRAIPQPGEPYEM
jgi:uncharacterized repeat protein (TIGR03943 family)